MGASGRQPSGAARALPLSLLPDPVLRKPAAPVETFGDELRLLVHGMIQTMYEHDGIGIAAPQVGRSLQLFVANPSRRRGCELIVANPVMLAAEGRTVVLEGCLSVPEVWKRVRRAGRIRLAGRDLTGKPVRITAEGLLAVVLQHEVDHLHGRLFLDRLPWLRKRRALRKAPR